MDPGEESQGQSCPEPNVEISSEAQSTSKSGKMTSHEDERSHNVSSISEGQLGPTEEKSENAPESSHPNGSDQNGNEANEEEDEDMDSTSEISDFSDFSQESWHPVQGPIAWVQEQMRQGQNARSILEDLVPPGTMIPDDLDPIMLWRLIINIVSEPPKRKKLESINTLEDVISLMKSCNKIIVLTGAGVSVSCGIPDFRSRDGVYARLAVDFPNLPDPQAMFDIHFFRSDPRPFFKFAKEIYPGQFKPSLCHHFIRLIESQGKLLRNYTQNIDTLEQEAGIERVVQCHGSFATATCTNCKLKVKADVVREDIFNQVIPKCPRCPAGTENAIMKPDIVFFGESLPEDFHKQMAQDKDECDLLIVIGSSLKVRPVALIPNSVPAHVPQILINRERLHYLSFDVELLGNCDDIVGELCHRLGTGWDQLAPPNVSPLTEVVMSSLPTPPTSPQSPRPHPTTSTSSSSPPPSSSHSAKQEQDAAVVVRVKRKKDSSSLSSDKQAEKPESATKTEANVQKKEEGNDDVEISNAESEQKSASHVAGSASSKDDKAECQSTETVVQGGRGDCVINSSSKPVSSSSSSSAVESVSSSSSSSSILPPTSSNASLDNKTEKEKEKTEASDALTDEVSTTTTNMTTSTKAKPHPHNSSVEESSRVSPQQKKEQSHGQGSSESDIVSSTSNEPSVHNHHHKHHHHHHDNHKHSHHHHHNHHHNHGHNHHHHHHSNKKSPSTDHHQQNDDNESHSESVEPVEKRPRLEKESEGEASSSSSTPAATTTTSTSANATAAGGSQEKEDGLPDYVDDELEEMRKMWQGRKNRVSLAQRLADDQYLFLPPNRYVFKGAEVFSDSDDDNDNDSDSDENGEEGDGDEGGEADQSKNGEEAEDGNKSKDVGADAELQEEVEEQVVEVDEMPISMEEMNVEGSGSNSATSSTNGGVPAVTESDGTKDRMEEISSTNDDDDGHDKHESVVSLAENQ